MEMQLHNWLLVAAGCIGIAVAVVHGVLVHRLMAVPVMAGTDYAPSVRRLVPLLLQFSTFCWLLGGIALVATPAFPERSAVLITAAFVGTFYLFGAVGNFWGTRGRHPGWVLLAIAVALIGLGCWSLPNVLG